jgi:hypothetical protein
LGSAAEFDRARGDGAIWRAVRSVATRSHEDDAASDVPVSLLDALSSADGMQRPIFVPSAAEVRCGSTILARAIARKVSKMHSAAELRDEMRNELRQQRERIAELEDALRLVDALFHATNQQHTAEAHTVARALQKARAKRD